MNNRNARTPQSVGDTGWWHRRPCLWPSACVRILPWLFSLAFLAFTAVSLFAQTDTALVAQASLPVAPYVPPSTGSSIGDTIVTFLMPLVVALGTWVVTHFFPKLPGWLIPSVIVPVLATLLGVIASFSTGTHDWWVKALAGLGAVLLHQVKQQVDRGDQLKDTTKVTH